MGLFFSCCRRRKDSADREPLLPKHRVDASANQYLPSQTQLTKLADIIAALKTGKLPSQDQLCRILQLVLRTTAVETDTRTTHGTLSEPGKQVLADFSELLESLLLLGLEKNDDNQIQELLYRISKIPKVPVHADVIVDAPESSTLDIQDVVGEIPSKEEAVSDVAAIVHSIRELSTIVLTSSTFRVILSDLFKTAREITADTAADVGRIAATVEASADKVEEALRPDGATLEDIKTKSKTAEDDVTNQASAVSEETRARWNYLSTESPERTKEAIVGRLQQAMAQAHSNPKYQRALRTILYLLQDYIDRLSNISTALADARAPNITPILWTDPHLSKAMSHISILVSRLASGHHVDRWTDRLRSVILDLSKLPAGVAAENDELRQLRRFFAELGSWLDLALDNPQYATSSPGQRDAEVLYDHAHDLINDASHSDKPWARHIRELIHETDELLEAIKSDRTTNRLIDAVSALSTSLSTYTQTAVRTMPGQLNETKRRVRAQLQRDLLQWLLPRVLRALHVIPVPRVEYSSSSLDAAIDTLYLTPASAQLSLVPDHIRVQNWTEVQLDLAEVHPETENIVPAVEYTGMQTFTRLRVSMKGIRLSARDIGYYAFYRLFGRTPWLGWLGYEDEGLASVDIGGRGATDEGLSLDFELEFQTDTGDARTDDGEPLFIVREVQVDVPGLRVSLDRSKHWLLNKVFLQPLAGSVGRLATAWVLRSQLRALLESFGQLGGRVVQEARRSMFRLHKEPEAGDYIGALWNVLGSSSEESTEGQRSNETDEAPLVETHTTATAKGIVRRSMVHDPDGADAAPPEEESVLAIGVGEQLLPGKGGPHDGHGAGEEYGPRELARDALDQIQFQVDAAVEAEEIAVDRGTRVRKEIGDAAVRERRREREEALEGGWKSDAFDV